MGGTSGAECAKRAARRAAATNLCRLTKGRTRCAPAKMYLQTLRRSAGEEAPTACLGCDLTSISPRPVDPITGKECEIVVSATSPVFACFFYMH